MDRCSPPLLTGSSTRLDCVLEVFDSMLMKNRTSEDAAEGDVPALDHGLGDAATAGTLHDKDAEDSRDGVCAGDGQVNDSGDGDSGEDVKDSVMSTGHCHSGDTEDVEASLRSRDDSTPTDAASLSDSPDSANTEAAMGLVPETTSVVSAEQPSTSRRGPLSSSDSTRTGDLSEASELLADSRTSEHTPTPAAADRSLSNQPPCGAPTKPDPAVDSGPAEPEPAVDSGLSEPADTADDRSEDEARALPDWGRAGPRRWRAEPRPRPLSSISTTSSSSSGAGSLPRALARRRPRLDSDAATEDAAATTGPRLSYLSSSGTSISSPTAMAPRGAEPGLTQADRVVAEIVQTEAVYVNDLREVIEGYLLYWRENPEPAITDEHLETLFGNYQSIYECNREFLSALEMCFLEPPRVAECFVRHQLRFGVYTDYCTQYPRAMATLTELMRRETTTARLFRERQVALGHTLPLGSYLLKPVQRILKYHLLLQSLMTRSGTSSAEDRAATAAALRTMRALAEHIDDMKRRHESAVRVQEIQSLLRHWQGDDLTTYGELQAEDTFRVPRAKVPRHVFLFEKMLLITKRRDDTTLVYKTHIMCSNLMLIESVPGEACSLQVLPFDDPKQQYTLQARSVDRKRQWALRLKSAILESYGVDIPKHARELVMKLGQHRENGEGLRRRIGRRHHSVPEYLERRKAGKRTPPAGGPMQGPEAERGVQGDPGQERGDTTDGPRARWSVHAGPALADLSPCDDDAPWPATGTPSLPDVDEEDADGGAADAAGAEGATVAEEDLQTIVEQLVMQNKHFRRLREKPRREVRRSPTSSSDSPSERELDSDSCREGELPSPPRQALQRVVSDSGESCQEVELSRVEGSTLELADADGDGDRRSAGVAEEEVGAPAGEPGRALSSPAPSALPPPSPEPDPPALTPLDPVELPTHTAITIESHDNVQYVSLFDYGARQSRGPSPAPTPAPPPPGRPLERSVSDPCRRVARRLGRMHTAGQSEVRGLLSGIRRRSARLSRHLDAARPRTIAEDPRPAPEDPRPAAEDPRPAAGDPRPAAEDPRPAPEDPRPVAEGPSPAAEGPSGLRVGEDPSPEGGAEGCAPGRRRSTWYIDFSEPGVAKPVAAQERPAVALRPRARRSGNVNCWRPLSQLFESGRPAERPQAASVVHAASVEQFHPAKRPLNRFSVSCPPAAELGNGNRSEALPAACQTSVPSIPAAENHKLHRLPLEDSVRRLRQRLSDLLLGSHVSARQPAPAGDALGARLATSDLLKSPLMATERRCPSAAGSALCVTSRAAGPSRASVESSDSESGSDGEEGATSDFYEAEMNVLEDIAFAVPASEVVW